MVGEIISDNDIFDDPGNKLHKASDTGTRELVNNDGPACARTCV